MYGSYNQLLNDMSETELRSADPQALLNLLSQLKNYKHTLLYYGLRV